ADARELFDFIDRYRPRDVDPPADLKPFVPDFQPAVGDIDEFVKIPRPDGVADELGLRVLDEPKATQSDPDVLRLKLRRGDPGATGVADDAEVPSIEPEDLTAEKINAWIESVNALHANDEDEAVVEYSHDMPDLETLMKPFEPEVEEALRAMKLPDENLDVTPEHLAKLMCGILDIPVYDDNILESVHVMFSLYLEFKNHPKFGKAAGG
ncbi:uncharacterized protein MICPUCDRAFT_4721, partial [Micromonas pusilla CCMP1545]